MDILNVFLILFTVIFNFLSFPPASFSDLTRSWIQQKCLSVQLMHLLPPGTQDSLDLQFAPGSVAIKPGAEESRRERV